MIWILGLALVVGLTLPAVGARGAELVRRGDEAQTIRVRIYDYARVPASILSAAKAAALQVLHRAGVRAEFVECPIRQDILSKDKACELPRTPLDLYLRILDKNMAKATGTTSNCMGYALLSNGFASTAAAFFHRATELEKTNLANRRVILGAIMAHEIGHLLLQQSDHSASGIMRANWDNEDLRMIARGRMRFTADEAERLLSMIARRQQTLRQDHPWLHQFAAPVSTIGGLQALP